MTWIVGLPVQFNGYALGCADIRVTLKNGDERDCLQKIYIVGPSVCAAFAGSVRIGFELLTRLGQLLRSAPSGTGWDLDEVAKWWPSDARGVWNRMPGTEQRLGSEIMLFGVHPNQGTPWPRAYVYIFRSPNFDAVGSTGALEACSIGKGAGITIYRDPLKKAFEENDDIVQLEAGIVGGIGRGMVDLITDRLLAYPIPGISPHLHVFRAHRDKVVATTNDRHYFHSDGSMKLVPELVMPPVVSNYEDFLVLVGGSAAAESAQG